MVGKKTQARVVEQCLPVSFKGKWPPNLSRLSGIGFDKISTSKSCVTIRKIQTRGMGGAPQLFVEVELRKNKSKVRYSCSDSADDEIRRMHATLFLLRAISLTNGFYCAVEDLARLVLPSLECAEKTANEQYSLVSKRCVDMHSDLAELSLKNRSLSRASELSASRVVALESKSVALQERVRKLEAVSGAALRELIMEWLRSHRGSFNIAAFSQSAHISPSRCEEGIGLLLTDGAISEVGGGKYTVNTTHSRMFKVEKTGVSSTLLQFLPFLKKQ